ncbi:leucine-rich repeat and IQ domain-containing protein 1 [Entelurus aequoreus]|uniref:leucine-rich repeat and IQ domain-containing protein 1 n=1 Tax=Entelurus aequoreus TaxID=161455 RepID=UPI002B1DF9BB|nr:leucine-rich repeat and IQ domain-containing protein 1 [Entelurus aequoreus]
MAEANDAVMPDTEDEDADEESRNFSADEEEASDEIPASLVSYFEASRRRLEACKKIILEDLQGVTASPSNERTTKQAEFAEDEQKPADPDPVLHADQDVLSPDSQGECGAEECDNFLSDEEGQSVSNYQQDGGGRALQVEVETSRRREQDFEEELKRMMEVEKLRQKEVDLMEKKAQEELEQEFQLQQELVHDLKRRVEEEVKMRKEEQKRLIERKGEDEERQMKKDGKRNKGEEEERREEEEWEQIGQDEKRQKEEEDERREAGRKMKEEVRRMREVEENKKKKKEEEDERRTEAVRKQMEEEVRKMRQEEKKKRKEEEEEERKLMEEEVRRRREEKKKEEEEERKPMDEEVRRRREEEKSKRKEEEEERKLMEEEVRRTREEEKEKRKEEEEEERKLMEEEVMKRRGEKKKRKKEEEEERKLMEEEVRRRREEEKSKRKKEEEEERKLMEEEVMKRRGEKKKRKKEEEEERKLMEEEVRRRREEEKSKRKKEEEEERKLMEEEVRRTREEEKEKRKEEEEEERKLMEEEVTRMREEEENKRKKEEEDEWRKETKRKQMEEERWKTEEERKWIEDKERRKEDSKVEEKERKRREVEMMQMEEEVSKKMEEERRKEAAKKLKEEELTRKKEKDDKRKEAERKRMEEEEKRRESEEEEERQQKEEDVARKREEEEKTWQEAGRMKVEEKEEENKDLEEEERSKRSDEDQRNDEDERMKDKEEKMIEKEEEDRMTQDEEMRTRRKEEEKRRSTSRKCEQRKEEEDGGVTKMEEEEELPVKDEGMMDRRDEKMDERINDEENSGKKEKDGCGSRTSGQKNPKEEVREEEEEIFKMETHEVEEDEEAERRQDEQRMKDNSAAPSRPPQPPPDNTRHKSSSFSQNLAQRRRSWMESCVFWAELSVQNRSRSTGSVGTRREFRRSTETSVLPPLCPDILKQSTGRRSLQEVTTLLLEDLPGCSLSTLAQCARLQSLTLRRCGLTVLDSINQLAELRYVDVQQNDIWRVDCENMSDLRALKLGRNKLTSIHGLSGAENLDLLELSHNAITRVAGLGSLRRLQRLSLDHNQLISTKGLKDVCTLLHLDCSHNHLASVEGLDGNLLLTTLDLTCNNLTEPPALYDHVLLQELRLGDNSISSLRGLAACWLPLLQTLNVARNRLTHLPHMSAAVSLSNLDLRYNCLSDLKEVCQSLEGSPSLKEVHLMGNPLQQESSWRSTLQRTVPSLRTIDGTDADFTQDDVARQTSPSSDSFLKFIQEQLQQTRDLKQKHSEQLSKDLNPLDVIRVTCRHFAETLRLAKDHRRAHECADIDDGEQKAAGLFVAERVCDGEVPPVPCNKESRHDTSPEQEVSPCCDVQSPATEGKFTCQDVSPKSADAGLAFTSEDGGGKTKCGASSSNVAKRHAAAIIQAHWRGFTLRRRLASALAAVAPPDTGQEDIFEVVDLDEFVVDEATLERGWSLALDDELPTGCSSVLKQQLPGSYHGHSQLVLPPLPVRGPTQAWEIKDQDDSTCKTVSAQSAAQMFLDSESWGRQKNCQRICEKRNKSVASGLSERSEDFLEEWGFTNRRTAELMLRRAQRMKSKKKSSGPPVHVVACRNAPLTTYPLGPLEGLCGTDGTKVLQAEVCLRRARQDRTREWLRNQDTLRSSGSEHFLPDISSDVLSGGRPQRAAEPGHAEHRHHTSGVWAGNSLLVQTSRENDCDRQNPLVTILQAEVCLRRARQDRTREWLRNQDTLRSSGRQNQAMQNIGITPVAFGPATAY